MVAWDPWLIQDLGFQLSAVATAGLVLFATPLSERLRPLPQPVRDWAAATIAAQLATLPIVLGTFHTVSFVAPLANLTVAPVIPVLTILGGLLSVLGSLPLVGEILGVGCLALGGYVVAVIRVLGGVPGAVVFTGQLPAWLAVAWYTALAAIGLARSPEITGRFGELRRIRYAAIGAPLMLVVASPMLVTAPSGRVTISLLDVGAPAVFVRGPTGRTLVATAGASASALTASLGQRLALWEHGVDVAVALHRDGRTAAALAGALGRYPASVVVAPPAGVDGLDVEFPSEALVAAPGLRIELEPGVVLDIIDVRSVDGRTRLDVALSTDAVSVVLPAPGAPSARWRDIEPDRPAVVRLPGQAPRWLDAAGLAGPLAVVGDGVLHDDRLADLAVPLLDHRDVGAIDLIVDRAGVSMIVERCPNGAACAVAIAQAGD